MKLQNIIAEQGEKSIGYLEVPGTELKPVSYTHLSLWSPSICTGNQQS